MKLIKLIVIALMVATTFTACKKDKTTPKIVSIEGKWVGSYKYGDNNPADLFLLLKQRVKSLNGLALILLMESL
ncbi:MAG: hypothetical protein WBP45_02345 [Daejeonella sp.]